MSQSTFRSLTLSFKTTSLETRELVALDADQSLMFLTHIKERTSATDVLVLSTCNRTEIYYSSVRSLNNEIIALLASTKGINPNQITSHFRSIDNANEAVSHLFNVAIGLEAQVIGDLQITNQVKQAYQQSADMEMAGPFLHRLMHTIFFSNKKVVHETSFRDGAASVSYATVELIEELTTALPQPKVLLLGLGEMGADVARNLLHLKETKVLVMNRTKAKADQIAAECGYEVVDIDTLTEAISNCDVIVSSVRGDQPLIDKELLSKCELLSFKYLIDMSVPRSVDVSVEELPGVLVYNIDQIKNKASEALEKRKNSIPLVSSIVDQSIKEFLNWTQEMEVSPTIQKLKGALEEIRKSEIDRYVNKLSENEADHVDMITKNIMQKIIKLPVLQLKAACQRGEAETLIDVLNDLFNLEEQAKPAEK